MAFPIHDRDEIRRRLNSDRIWSLYALADLDPGLFEMCGWWAAGEGLALVFNGIAIRPIFVIGNEDEARELLEALPADTGYLNLRAGHLAAAEGIFSFGKRNHMHRMALGEFTPRPHGPQPVPLGPADEEEILRLYASGSGAGVAFGSYQLATGFFRGVRENGELVAVAGVHVVSTAEGVAGAGNVFTRVDRRGRGLAQSVTSAVTAALLEAGITTIGLNVEAANLPAIAAYERLGFRAAFEYWEGPAARQGAGRIG